MEHKTSLPGIVVATVRFMVDVSDFDSLGVGSGEMIIGQGDYGVSKSWKKGCFRACPRVFLLGLVPKKFLINAQ